MAQKGAASVEHSYQYCQEMYSSNVTNCLIASGKLMYLCTAVGPSQLTWGVFNSSWVQKPESEVAIRTYVEALSLIRFPWHDMILVDGRFRVAVALFAATQISPHTLVAVHDFPRYHKKRKANKAADKNFRVVDRSLLYRPLEKCYRLVQRTLSLAIYRRRPGLQTSAVLELYKQFLRTQD